MRFSEISRGYKREYWEEVGQETVLQICLFPLWIYKVVILKKRGHQFQNEMLAVVPMTFQILPQQLSTAWNEVDLGRIFHGQLLLNCIFKESRANFGC